MAIENKTVSIPLTSDEIDVLLKLVWDFKTELIRRESWSFVDEMEELYNKLDVEDDG
jgi:hypothetical protein